MKSIVNRIINRPWFYPLALLLVGIATYGLMIPRLGFYWDDWESVYLYYLSNPAVGFGYYAERPFSVLPYLVFFPVAKMTPVVWQSLALLLRCGGILFLYFTLNTVWPRQVICNRLIGILLLVFPGYLLQPVSTAFNQHLSVFLLFTLSLYLTVLAIKNQKLFWLFMPLSVITGVVQCFMMEYFVGLEIIRPILIWFMLRSKQEENNGAVFRKTVLIWLPFIIGAGVYGWWRLIYLPTFLQSDPNTPVLLKTILSSPKQGFIDLVNYAIQDARYLLAISWTRPSSPDVLDLNSKITIFSWFIGILIAILTSIYLSCRPMGNEPKIEISSIQMIFLGSVALIGGGAPVWVLGRQITSGKWSDRFALASMVGAVILVVSAWDWLLRTRTQKQCFFAILMASSISLQIYNCNKFRLDWEKQLDAYWQLSWRIPNLKPGTAIIGSGAFSEKSSPYDGIYIINLLFDQQISENPRYAYLDIDQFPSYNYRPDVAIVNTIRGGGQFYGNTSQAIGIFMKDTRACVRVLDSIYSEDPKFTDDVNKLIVISNLDSILTNNGTVSPNPSVFGKEIRHDWCYYFEKADLARQMQDWQTILKLRSEAESKGLTPEMGAEYLPFIEAYAQTGHWSDAYQLSLAAKNLELEDGLNNTLCNNWNRFLIITTGSDTDFLNQAKTEFCSVQVN